MKVFPEKEITIKTNLSATDAINRLSERVDKPSGWFKLFNPAARSEFEGVIGDQEFFLISTVDYSRVKGRVYPEIDGAVVKATVKLHPVSSGIHYGFILGTSVFCLVILFAILKTLLTKGIAAAKFSWPLSIPFLLPLIVFYIWRLEYKRTVDRNFRYLKKILQ